MPLSKGLSTKYELTAVPASDLAMNHFPVQAIHFMMARGLTREGGSLSMNPLVQRAIL